MKSLILTFLKEKATAYVEVIILQRHRWQRLVPSPRLCWAAR